MNLVAFLACFPCHFLFLFLFLFLFFIFYFYFFYYLLFLSSSIHTPLISLSTPFLNTPLYYLFTPHSITKISHPNPIDTPRLSTPLGFVLPNPQTPKPILILPISYQKKPPNPENRPSSAPREPAILHTETREPPKSEDQVSLV